MVSTTLPYPVTEKDELLGFKWSIAMVSLQDAKVTVVAKSKFFAGSSRESMILKRKEGKV